MHTEQMCLSLFMPLTPCQHMTHRARYVRAGCSLAVGPGCRRASDFLLLPQQLAVLLLSVLHVDQQRDEAVLHLVLQMENSLMCAVFFNDQTALIITTFNYTYNYRNLFLSAESCHWSKLHYIAVKLRVIHWSWFQNPELCGLFSLHSRCSKSCLQIKFLISKHLFTSKHHCVSDFKIISTL